MESCDQSFRPLILHRTRIGSLHLPLCVSNISCHISDERYPEAAWCPCDVSSIAGYRRKKRLPGYHQCKTIVYQATTSVRQSFVRQASHPGMLSNHADCHSVTSEEWMIEVSTPMVIPTVSVHPMACRCAP